MKKKTQRNSTHLVRISKWVLSIEDLYHVSKSIKLYKRIFSMNDVFVAAFTNDTVSNCAQNAIALEPEIYAAPCYTIHNNNDNNKKNMMNNLFLSFDT